MNGTGDERDAAAAAPHASGEAEMRALEGRVRQLSRERSLLAALLCLALVAFLVDRVGQRVWAVSVWDNAAGTFVEQVYLPQHAQVMQALDLVRRSARAGHPVYGDSAADSLFAAAQPGWESKVVITRVRRSVPFPAFTNGDHKANGVAAPVLGAAEALSRVLRVVVDGYSIWDEHLKRPLAVLPTEAMAKEALEARLEAVAAKVRSELRSPDHLVSQDFLQTVSIRPQPHWPMSAVLSVPQAVDYLTRGNVKEAVHEVQQGERASDVAAKYGARLDALASWNPGVDLGRLRVGEKLRVRRPEAPLSVITVERRTSRDGGDQVTVEVRRQDGLEIQRQEVDRRPAR